jgi:ABC-2 type transport system permease protein
VLSIGFLLAYIYVFSNMQGYFGELVSKGGELAEAFQRTMPPFYVFGKSVAEGSMGNGLIFTLCAVLPFAAAVILLSANYRKILITNRGGVKTVYREKTAKKGNALSALVRKELAHYWSKPSVILNSSLGSLGMLALSVILIVKQSDILSYVGDFTPMLGNPPPAFLAAAVLVFLNTANNLSSSLVSLEGDNLWIVKSIPVPPRTVIQSKMCTHLILSGIPCLTASICAAIVLAGSILDGMVLVLLPQAACALIAVGGLAINLHFPKLDWTNEIYVVKQGLSAMLAMFGGMGAIVGLGLAYVFLLNTIVSLTLFLWLCTVLFAVAALLVYAWMITSGEKKFSIL